MTSLDVLIKVRNNYSELVVSPEIDLSKRNIIYQTVIEFTTGNYLHFYKNDRVVKSVPLADWKLTQIPTGLVDGIIEMLTKIGINVNLKDERTYYPDRPQPIEFPYSLDNKQIEAIDVGLKNRRGYFKAPTGAGKTSIIASLIANIGGLSLVLVPSIDLVRQTSEDLENFLKIKVWRIQGVDSLYDPISTNVAVASIDTLWSNIDKLKIEGWFHQFQSVYADECHHITYTKEKVTRDGRKVIKRSPPGTTAYYKILMETDAYNRFGFTATDEDSEFYIKAALGSKIFEIDEDYLISIGRLSKPYIIIYEHQVPYYLEEREATRENIYLNEGRNAVLLNGMKTVTELGGSVLFMLDSKKYQLKMIENWTHFPILTGDTNGRDREEVYNKLRNKEIQGIILTVGKEGLNIPSVDCIIRASGKKSIRLVKQEKGRGARITPTKNRYIIIDTFDDDGVNRKMREDGTWRTKKGHLKKQSQERLEIYKSIKSAEIFIVKSVEELEQKIKEVF